MMRLRPAALLPLVALGCTADRGEEATILMQQALSSAQASLALAGNAVPARTGASGGSAIQAAGTTAPARMASAPQPGPRLAGVGAPSTAAALMGRSAEQTRRMLGDPALRRAEGDAEIWLYEATPCRLDIVLYPQGGELTVAYAAARAHGQAQGVTEAACLSAIATAPAIQPWGDPGRRA